MAMHVDLHPKGVSAQVRAVTDSDRCPPFATLSICAVESTDQVTIYFPNVDPATNEDLRAIEDLATAILGECQAIRLERAEARGRSLAIA